MEGWKFAIYLSVPIICSFWFASPERQRKNADYWQYVKYPSNPNTNLREAIDEYAKTEKQRQIYREQLRALQESEVASVEAAESAQNELEQATPRWWHWRRYWKATKEDEASTDSTTTR